MLVVQVEAAVTFWVDASENVPVEVSVIDEPTLTVLLAGLSETLDRVGGGGAGAVTVNTVVPEIAPSCALMVEVPAATPFASPLCETVAVAVTLLDHVGD